MPAGRNVPVLIGAVPLFTVTSLTLNEGYQVARIAGSSLAQLVSPTTKTITIEGVLVGSTRLIVKKALEGMALNPRPSEGGTAKTIGIAGVPVVDPMRIT